MPKAKAREPKPEIEHTPAANQQNPLFVPVSAFCIEYDVAKKKHEKGEVTNEECIDEFLQNINEKGSDPSKKKKATKKAKPKEEPPKYKRITVEQYDEYQALKTAK
jgi:hypothetical protein